MEKRVLRRSPERVSYRLQMTDTDPRCSFKTILNRCHRFKSFVYGTTCLADEKQTIW